MRQFVIAMLAGLFPAAAFAAEYGWRQDDWSGGPNQALFQDATRYESSTRADTRNVPGKVRISFLSGQYTKDASNPVLDKGAAGDWDENYVSGFPRKKDNGTGYEILYRGSKGTWGSDIRAVGYAESSDGIAWTKYSGNPVLQKSGTEAWDAEGIGTGSLVKDGDTYHLFFRGYAADNKSRYGHATSTDLKTWTRGTNFVFGPGSAGEWDEENLWSFSVRKIGDMYHAWYVGEDAAGTSQIGHATSADGDAWTRDTANPVLAIGGPGQWDDGSIWEFVLLERTWNGDFLIVYSAEDSGLTTQGIGIATSPDGSVWTKDPLNAVFWEGGPWYQDGIDPYTLRFDGSIYSMYLLGYDSSPVAYKVGEACSEDGSVWNISPFPQPLLSPSPSPAWDEICIFANYPFVEDNTLRTFYVGGGTATILALGTATATPSYNATADLVSSVFDAEGTVDWKSVNWHESKPGGTDVKVEVRCGNTATPDASWTAWAQVTNGGQNPHADSRYMQYRVTLSTTDPAVSPEFWGIAFNLPIDLTPNKTTFSTSDTISVTADVEPISTPFYPFVRIVMADGLTLYFRRGEGFRNTPVQYIGDGPMTIGSEIMDYPVLTATFSNLEPGTYILEGGAVDATKTTSVNNLMYINPIDTEMLTVQ